MSGKHGEPLRGLMATNRSQMFEGRFGRMFRSLRPATFGDDDDANHKNLGELGAKMSNSFDARRMDKTTRRAAYQRCIRTLANSSITILRLTLQAVFRSGMTPTH